MATVCVGPELRPDEQGRLRLNMCGAPAEQAWPYACSPATANPLRVDPDCGLWMPPGGRIATVEVSGNVGGNPVTIPATWGAIDSADITITNPSPCYPARVMRWVNVDIDYNIPYNDARAAGRIAGNTFNLIENPAPTSGSEMTDVHWEHTQPILSDELIPPGGSQTYTALIEVGLGQGGAQWAGCRWNVYALVMAGFE